MINNLRSKRFWQASNYDYIRVSSLFFSFLVDSKRSIVLLKQASFVVGVRHGMFSFAFFSPPITIHFPSCESISKQRASQFGVHMIAVRFCIHREEYRYWIIYSLLSIQLFDELIISIFKYLRRLCVSFNKIEIFNEDLFNEQRKVHQVRYNCPCTNKF